MGLDLLGVETQAVGYHLIRVEDGYMTLVGVPFGMRSGSGRFESFSNEAINEVYLGQLGLTSNDEVDFFEFDYKEGSAILHIGVPKDYIKSLMWSDIFTSHRYLITLVVDGHPQAINADWAVKIHNVITLMTKSKEQYNYNR